MVVKHRVATDGLLWAVLSEQFITRVSSTLLEYSDSSNRIVSNRDTGHR